MSTPRGELCTQIALGALAFGVAFGCLFFGAPPQFGVAHGAPAWFAGFLETLTPYFVLQMCTTAAVVALAAGSMYDGVPRPTKRMAAWRPLAGLLGLCVVQSMGLVPFEDVLAPLFGEIDARLGGERSGLTLWEAGTENALWTLAGMLAAWVAIERSVRADRRRGAPLRTAKGLARFVVAIAVLQCLYGFYETWLADDGYLGLEKLSGKGRVTGTFIHGTMLAVWAGMGACAALALAGCWWIKDDSQRVPRAGALAAAALLCLAGAQFSLSRLGFVAAGAGTLFALWKLRGALTDAGRSGAARIGTLAVFATPALAVVTVLAVPRFRQRVGYLTDWLAGNDVPEEPRFAMWSATWDLFLESPLLGTGLGSFGRAVHLVQHDTIPQELWFAHSDVLNLLSDGGIVGLVLGVAWIVLAYRRGAPALRDGTPAARCLAAGAFGASLVVLVAALGDFQTQFPVVAIPLAALLAVPASLMVEEEPANDAPGTDAAPDREQQLALVLHLCKAMTLGWYTLLFALHAAAGYVDRWSHHLDGHPPGATAAEREVIVGRAVLQAGGARSAEAALRHFVAAAVDDPLYDRAHLWRAIALVKAGRRDTALRHFGRARWVSRGHTDVNLLIGQVYLDLLDRSDAPYGPPGDSAFAALREAGALAPAAFAEAFRLGVAKRLSADELKRLVPERAHAWIHYADYLRRTGEEPDVILEALERAVKAEPRHLAARLRLVLALLDLDRTDEARPHALRILTQAPDDETFPRELARAYDAAGHGPAGRDVFAEASVPFPDTP